MTRGPNGSLNLPILRKLYKGGKPEGETRNRFIEALFLEDDFQGVFFPQFLSFFWSVGLLP